LIVILYRSLNSKTFKDNRKIRIHFNNKLGKNKIRRNTNKNKKIKNEQHVFASEKEKK